MVLGEGRVLEVEEGLEEHRAVLHHRASSAAERCCVELTYVGKHQPCRERTCKLRPLGE